MTDTETRQPTCPICKKPSTESARPFCSRRCADVDLGRWFSGVYAIAGDDADTPDANDDQAAH